jgi:hypothetical protein
VIPPDTEQACAGNHRFDCAGRRTLQHQGSRRGRTRRRAGVFSRIRIRHQKALPRHQSQSRNDQTAIFAPLHDLLDRAYQAGCIVVAAANNLPQPSFPSVFSSSLISVIKSAETDPFNFGFHYGEVIELTAPGVNVRTPWLGAGYRNLTGNSFACPHIVGIIALLLDSHPDLTPFEVKSALYAIAKENSEKNAAEKPAEAEKGE